MKPLVELLKDRDFNIRSNAIVTLGQLGTHGEHRIYVVTGILMRYKVELYESIRAFELPLLKLLKDSELIVRSSTTGAIERLVAHGER